MASPTSIAQQLFVEHPSPVGTLVLTGRKDALTGCWFTGLAHRTDPREGRRRDPSAPALAEAARQLDEYFAGQRTAFELVLEPAGTPFQLGVWAALATIPYGETRTYGAIASQVGTPTGSRAVGLANGRNPISIIVPCHRVIGADGSLTGYGGGMDRKRWLLALEAGTPSLL